MKKHFQFLALSVVISFSSCIMSEPAYVRHPSIYWLSYYQWHLISITNTNKSIPRYNGTAADSLRFTWKWANNGDVLLDSIFSYVNGGINKYSGNYSFGITSVQGNYIDTVQCYPNWKSGFSNTMVIQSIAHNFLVLKICDTANAQIETDSLFR